MRHTFHTEQWIPFPAEEVFAFFANPENLPPLMPSTQRARIERMMLISPDVHPANLRFDVAGAGSQLTISFCPIPLLPFRLHWDSAIVDFEWGRTFSDEQLQRGPFHYWKHRHSVRSEDRNGIVGAFVTDDLEYEVPLSALGEVANKLFVHRQIRSIFAYRQSRLLDLLSGASWVKP